MHSRTKAVVTEGQLREMVEVAGIGPIQACAELTGGEYNLAYHITTPKGRFVLKIGPNAHTRTMTYEKDLMALELWGYDLLRRKTDITIPDIVHSGKEVIGNDWFVMSELPGTLYCDAGLTDAQKERWLHQYGGKIAQMHLIHNDTYGYRQLGQHSTWKEAYYDMVFTAWADIEEQGVTLPGGPAIFRYIRKYEHVLDTVRQPTFVHYDLFTNNVFADAEGNFAGLIDIERCFWGDFYADFVAYNLFGQLTDIPAFIEGYNEVADEKIEITPETRARMSLARLYVGMLLFGEGNTRLAIDDVQYWKRRLLGVQVIHYALHELDDLATPSEA